MLSDPSPETRAGFEKYLILSGVVLLLAGLYVGWVFYSRWEANRALEEKAATERRSQNRQTFEAMGGSRFEILSLYADPGNIRAGETAELCYSVSNAKSVTLDPPAEPVWPAFSRCVHVSPRKTTTYTFTAEDGQGHTKSATVKVEVR
jgi:hypothetical protein